MYSEVFKELNRRKARYLVVGGVAVVLHGVVRLTIDLDILADLETENLKKVVAAMDALGFVPRAPVKAGELLDSDKRAAWIKEKNMVAFSFYNPKKQQEVVDLIIKSDLHFDKAYAGRDTYVVGGVKVPVISLESLEEMKASSGRKQDLADLEALKYLKEVRHEKNER